MAETKESHAHGEGVPAQEPKLMGSVERERRIAELEQRVDDLYRVLERLATMIETLAKRLT